MFLTAVTVFLEDIGARRRSTPIFCSRPPVSLQKTLIGKVSLRKVANILYPNISGKGKEPFHYLKKSKVESLIIPLGKTMLIAHLRRLKG